MGNQYSQVTVDESDLKTLENKMEKHFLDRYDECVGSASPNISREEAGVKCLYVHTNMQQWIMFLATNNELNKSNIEYIINCIDQRQKL